MPRIAITPSLKVNNADDLYRCALVLTPKADGVRRHGRSPVVEISKAPNIYLVRGYGMSLVYGADEVSLAQAARKPRMPILIVYAGKPKKDGPLLSMIEKINAADDDKTARLLQVPSGEMASAWDIRPNHIVEEVEYTDDKYAPKQAMPKSLDTDQSRASRVSFR